MWKSIFYIDFVRALGTAGAFFRYSKILTKFLDIRYFAEIRSENHFSYIDLVP